MSKAKKNGGQRRSRKTPETIVASPPATTTEQLNDEQLQVLFFQHKRTVKSITAQIDLAQAEVKRLKQCRNDAFGLAKAEGIGKDELELALKLETDEGRTELERRREREERVTRWLGEPLGSQGDLVGDAQFEAGKRAAMSDEMRKPPAQLGQRDHQRWLEGFDKGVEIMNAQRASGFKQLGDAKATTTTIQ